MSEPVAEQEARDGPRRFQAVSAGILALAGTALTIAGNLLQQRAEIPRGDPSAVLGHIVGQPWFAAALVGVFGALCWAVAFATAGRILTEPLSRATAQMAEPVLIVAVAVFAVTYAHDGFSSGVLAQQWSAGGRDAAGALADMRVTEGLVGGTSALSQPLLGLALAVYALAMLRSGRYSRVLCWVGIVGTLGWFAGGSALFLHLVPFPFLLPFAGLAMIWVLGVGIALLRQGLDRGGARSPARRAQK